MSWSSSSRSSIFPESTKLKIKKKSGDMCWACSTTDPQIGHVLARDDRQKTLWFDKGLIDFPIDSFLNGIPLCETCHGQFDYALDPGFTFLPTDLQYFIDFEIKDRERRKALADDWVTIKREVPSAEMYKNHQVSQGLIGPDAVGGLYLKLFAKNYLLGGRLPFDAISYFSKPSEWHGAPLASLRRAIPILGTGRLIALDKNSRLQLESLRNLYFLDEEESPLPPENMPASARQTRRNTGNKRHPPSESAVDRYPPSKKQRTSQAEGNYNDGGRRWEKTFCPVLQREVTAHWSLGPDCSAEDAIRQLTPVLRKEMK